MTVSGVVRIWEWCWEFENGNFNIFEKISKMLAILSFSSTRGLNFHPNSLTTVPYQWRNKGCIWVFVGVLKIFNPKTLQSGRNIWIFFLFWASQPRTGLGSQQSPKKSPKKITQNFLIDPQSKGM